ncbi:MAG: Uma2 family endonuclease [Okeania sp. SIO2H7]|nr:Uma2 family endonuclease [Okeania sp. SIO2H7]
MNTVTLNLKPIFQMTDDQFYRFCRSHPDTKFERNANGQIIITPPSGGEIGIINAEISTDFVLWNRQTKLGILFDSSTCFKLPNNAVRSPDVSWVKKERWEALTPEERIKFPPLAPDFVLELMSPTDTLKETQAKMQEYLENEVKLGWLIEPKTRRVEIYRQGKDVEVLTSPSSLSGENILPGFIFNPSQYWLNL